MFLAIHITKCALEISFFFEYPRASFLDDKSEFNISDWLVYTRGGTSSSLIWKVFHRLLPMIFLKTVFSRLLICCVNGVIKARLNSLAMFKSNMMEDRKVTIFFTTNFRNYAEKICSRCWSLHPAGS